MGLGQHARSIIEVPDRPVARFGALREKKSEQIVCSRVVRIESNGCLRFWLRLTILTQPDQDIRQIRVMQPSGGIEFNRTAQLRGGLLEKAHGGILHSEVPVSL